MPLIEHLEDVVVVVVADRFCFLYSMVHEAVSVTSVLPVGPVWVIVEATSLIGTKELQKAEALRATSTAFAAATLLRASISGRPMLAAEERRASEVTVAAIEAEEMCMIADGADEMRMADCRVWADLALLYAAQVSFVC